MQFSTSHLARSALSIAALLGAAATHAQTAPDGLWHGGISLGGAVSAGNTSSQNLAGSADAVRAMLHFEPRLRPGGPAATASAFDGGRV